MKQLPLLKGIIPLAFICSLALIACQPGNSKNEQFEAEETEEEGEEESGADKQLNMWFQHKAYPDPFYLTDKYERAWQQHLRLKEQNNRFYSRVESGTWTSMGQSIDSGGDIIGGRVVCLAIDPNNSNNLWAGSASGGIWKSTNAGASWSHVITNHDVLGVSAILIDPNNSSIIYAGTGEVYRVDTSNIGFNVWKTRGTYGIGVLKSIDAGVTWTQKLIRTTPQMFGIQSMAFRPGATATDTIFACATDGLYRSPDFGDTWVKILDKIYVKDIAINPSNTNEIVVSVGNMVNLEKGIWRTTDGNAATPTWVQITSGLPAAPIHEGSIKLDNVGSGELVASIGRSSSTASTNREVYRSTNFGLTWTVVGGTTAATTTNHCSYQFWFAHDVAINPFDVDSLLFAGVGWYRYRRSNTTKTTVPSNTVHADVHDIVFDPVRRGHIYVCCDGGIYKSTNGGVNFSAINNGLNATQFYASLGVSRTNPNKMVGGLQDNGQVLYNGTSWVQVSWAGGDGTSCAIDPNNDQFLLVSRDAKQVYRSTNGGSGGGAVTNYWGFQADSRTGFVAPLAWSKSNSDSVFLASDNLHLSTNRGASFSNDPTAGSAGSATNYIEQQRKTAIALAVSPTNAKKIYVSTSPFAQFDNDANFLHINGQPNILKSLTGNTPFASIKNGLPDRFVMDFAISPTYDDSVFIVLGGFGTSHVYVTGNGGSTWTALDGAVLPDVPYNAILIDPVNPKNIYVGCDFGVYVSGDRGLTWADFNSGFWDATLVMDLQVSANNKLIAATHGKGVFEIDLFSGMTLPATLLDFGGINRNSYIELHWTVSQEDELLRYEIERSTDGINFQRIMSKISANSQNQVTYRHNDPVATNAPNYYYRLKMLDKDGSFTYSGIIFIQLATRTKINLVNNPFSDMIVLQYTLQRDEKINVEFMNTAGAVVRKRQYQASSGTGVYTIYGLDDLPAGTYLVTVNTTETRNAFKMIKK